MYLHIDASKLKEIRTQKGFTCYSLAKKSGIGLKSIWRYENGISTKTDNLRAKVIAKSLQCNIKDIFTEIEKDKK